MFEENNRAVLSCTNSIFCFLPYTDSDTSVLRLVCSRFKEFPPVSISKQL